MKRFLSIILLLFISITAFGYDKLIVTNPNAATRQYWNSKPAREVWKEFEYKFTYGNEIFKVKFSDFEEFILLATHYNDGFDNRKAPRENIVNALGLIELCVKTNCYDNVANTKVINHEKFLNFVNGSSDPEYQLSWFAEAQRLSRKYDNANYQIRYPNYKLTDDNKVAPDFGNIDYQDKIDNHWSSYVEFRGSYYEY